MVSSSGEEKHTSKEVVAVAVDVDDVPRSSSSDGNKSNEETKKSGKQSSPKHKDIAENL